MYKIGDYVKRYFPIQLKIDNGETEKIVELELEPPKLKVLRKLEKLIKNKENPVEELTQAMYAVLNKNKTRYRLSMDLIYESFDTDDMSEFLDVYFSWVREADKNPN